MLSASFRALLRPGRVSYLLLPTTNATRFAASAAVTPDITTAISINAKTIRRIEPLTVG